MATPFDPELARVYLTEHGIDVSSVKAESLLKRWYNAVRKAISKGEPVPSKEELQGHVKVKIYYLPEDKAKRRRPHWVMERAPAREKKATKAREAGDWDLLYTFQFTRTNLKALIAKVGKQGEYRLVITGWVKKYPGYSPSPDNPIKQLVAAINVNLGTLQDFLKKGYLPVTSEQSNNAIDFINELFSPSTEWVDLTAIAIPLFGYK